jgi:hypothetical protein
MAILQKLYNFYFMGVKEVRWEGSGTIPVKKVYIFYGRSNENYGLGSGFSVHKRII